MAVDQNKLTQSQIENISGPLELDLIAFFDIINDEINNLIDKSENKTLFELEKEMEDLFSG